MQDVPEMMMTTSSTLIFISQVRLEESVCGGFHLFNDTLDKCLLAVIT